MSQSEVRRIIDDEEDSSSDEEDSSSDEEDSSSDGEEDSSSDEKEDSSSEGDESSSDEKEVSGGKLERTILYDDEEEGLVSRRSRLILDDDDEMIPEPPYSLIDYAWTPGKEVLELTGPSSFIFYRERIPNIRNLYLFGEWHLNLDAFERREGFLPVQSFLEKIFFDFPYPERIGKDFVREFFIEDSILPQRPPPPSFPISAERRADDGDGEEEEDKKSELEIEGYKTISKLRQCFRRQTFPRARIHFVDPRFFWYGERYFCAFFLALNLGSKPVFQTSRPMKIEYNMGDRKINTAYLQQAGLWLLSPHEHLLRYSRIFEGAFDNGLQEAFDFFAEPTTSSTRKESLIRRQPSISAARPFPCNSGNGLTGKWTPSSVTDGRQPRSRKESLTERLEEGGFLAQLLDAIQDQMALSKKAYMWELYPQLRRTAIGSLPTSPWRKKILVWIRKCIRNSLRAWSAIRTSAGRVLNIDWKKERARVQRFLAREKVDLPLSTREWMNFGFDTFALKTCSPPVIHAFENFSGEGFLLDSFFLSRLSEVRSPEGWGYFGALHLESFRDFFADSWGAFPDYEYDTNEWEPKTLLLPGSV